MLTHPEPNKVKMIQTHKPPANYQKLSSSLTYTQMCLRFRKPDSPSPSLFRASAHLSQTPPLLCPSVPMFLCSLERLLRHEGISWQVAGGVHSEVGEANEYH
ncbi:hypothetical protein PAMP_010998 [Pampus punctatissimus]